MDKALARLFKITKKQKKKTTLFDKKFLLLAEDANTDNYENKTFLRYRLKKRLSTLGLTSPLNCDNIYGCN